MSKNKGGRPTKYREEYCEQMIEYFDQEPYKVDCNGKKDPNEFPTFSRFAVDIGVNRDTLKEWRNVHPLFSAAYKKCKELQRHILMTNGLMGLYAPAFACFTAKNVTDMRDKKEVDVSGGMKIVYASKEDEEL